MDTFLLLFYILVALSVIIGLLLVLVAKKK